MPDYSKIIQIGRLTEDVDVRFTPSGTAVAELNMATNHRYKKGDDVVEEVLFIGVTLFGKTAENCSKFLSKGSTVLVDGRLKMEQWETDGHKRSKIVIVAQSVQFLDSKSKLNDTSSEQEPS